MCVRLSRCPVCTVLKLIYIDGQTVGPQRCTSKTRLHYVARSHHQPQQLDIVGSPTAAVAVDSDLHVYLMQQRSLLTWQREKREREITWHRHCRIQYGRILLSLNALSGWHCDVSVTSVTIDSECARPIYMYVINVRTCHSETIYVARTYCNLQTKGSNAGNGLPIFRTFHVVI